MRTTIAMLTIATVLGLAGCSTEPTPAQKLAGLDGGSRSVSEYQRALDAWAARCQESPETLAGYTYATVEDLRKHGVSDESEYSALTHLKDATPAGLDTKCVDVAAGYLALREGGR